MRSPAQMIRRIQEIRGQEGLSRVWTLGWRKARSMGRHRGVRIDRFPPDERFPWYSMLDLDAEDLADNAAAVEAWRTRPSGEPIRSATWLMPDFRHAYFGGIYTILRFMDGLQRRGVDNRIVIFDAAGADTERIRRVVGEAFPALAEITVTAGTTEGRDPLADVEPTDIGVATLWMSAFALARWRGVRGKYYFVQDYEPEFYAAGSAFALAQQTYQLGFTGIVNTPGLAEAYAGWGNPVIPFTPSVDRDVFRPDADRPERPVRIVFYNRPSINRNAFGLGLAALQKVKEQYGRKVDIVAVGEDFQPARYGVQDIVRSSGLLPGLEAVAELYRSSHIGFVLMFTRHPSYQPFEYMASGCATVSNVNPWTDWFFNNGENAMLAEPTASQLAAAIGKLVDDPELRGRIASNGLELVQGSDWETEVEQVWDALMDRDQAAASAGVTR